MFEAIGICPIDIRLQQVDDFVKAVLADGKTTDLTLMNDEDLRNLIDILYTPILEEEKPWQKELNRQKREVKDKDQDQDQG